jgi:hypothetical protein
MDRRAQRHRGTTTMSVLKLEANPSSSVIKPESAG